MRVFYLDETSEIFRRRSEFDIVEIYPDEEADLQVYYDFKTSSGMSRREAREVYLEFTKALRSHFPVFQNTNMLYHELKGHYFLYLCKHGSWENLVANVLDKTGAQESSEVVSPSRPLRRSELVTRELAFDRAAIDTTLSTIDSHTLRPRYQSDLVEDDDRERLDVELPKQEKSPSTLVYDPATGEVSCVSPAAAALLERCDGSRTVEEVIEIIPAPHRADAERCLVEMAGAGLLSRAHEEARR